MKVTVNGEVREIETGASLEDLVASIGILNERIAIELNQSVIRKKDWPSTMVKNGDRVEIVHFVGGG